MSIKSLALAAAFTLLAGSAIAAEACACCKEGEKMECCDKMKDKAAAPKPGETAPAQPAPHQH